MAARNASAAGKTAAADDDIVLQQLYREPFRIARPAVQTVPFVFASPHSGRSYPSRFIAQSRLAFGELRRSEDAFVDWLFADVVKFGAPLIAAAFPRAYLDANRGPDELDAAMFDGPLPFAGNLPSQRVEAGLGVIPRIVREGAEIYRGKLAVAEAGERLARLYRPYHAALARLVAETVQRFGVATVIDCHSMPSAAAAPDIVLGDRHGLSVAPGTVERAERALARQGFLVVRNAPYAGGHTTQLYGCPGSGLHAVQIEVNRALYLDEQRMKLAPSAPGLRMRLAGALHELLEHALAAGLRQAAE